MDPEAPEPLEAPPLSPPVLMDAVCLLCLRLESVALAVDEQLHFLGDVLCLPVALLSPHQALVSSLVRWEQDRRWDGRLRAWLHPCSVDIGRCHALVSDQEERYAALRQCSLVPLPGKAFCRRRLNRPRVDGPARQSVVSRVCLPCSFGGSDPLPFVACVQRNLL